MMLHLLLLLFMLQVALSVKSKSRQFDDQDFLNNDMAQTSIYN